MNRTAQNVKEFYLSQLEKYNASLENTVKSIRRTSILRIVVFLATVTGIFISTAFNWILLLLITLVGFSFFIFLVIRHSRLYKERIWLENLVAINRSELEELAGNTSSRPEGMAWFDADHPYTSDLDIFGKRSLFQLLDRSATFTGQEKLAASLRQPILDTTLVKQRQTAIRELSNKPEFRQAFQASGSIQFEKQDAFNELKKWVQSEIPSFNNFFNRLMDTINPILGLSVVALIALNLLSVNTFLIFLFLPFGMIMPKMKSISKIHYQLSKKAELLRKYASLLTLIENESFDADMLKEAKRSLITGDKAASKAIQHLSSIATSFDYRLNMLMGILLNIFLLWDIRQVIRLEKWRTENQQNFDEWFDMLSKIDELSSFAAFAFNHPQSVFPELKDNSFLLKAKNAKHPFIPQSKSIGNDAEFTGWQQFHIITGANMAGKSTYLRTIGINLVLGMTGAPVLAEKFEFTPVMIYTGIKTSDSLQEGESYFFAELKRLEKIIQLLQNGDNLFIILDEILRGTNSTDKQAGSKALISQLLNFNASGMIATHDLTLGELAETFPGKVINQRFEVEIEDNELKFDYKLKEGISKNLNATFLMKKMGITI